MVTFKGRRGFRLRGSSLAALTLAGVPWRGGCSRALLLGQAGLAAPPGPGDPTLGYTIMDAEHLSQRSHGGGGGHRCPGGNGLGNQEWGQPGAYPSLGMCGGQDRDSRWTVPQFGAGSQGNKGDT